MKNYLVGILVKVRSGVNLILDVNNFSMLEEISLPFFVKDDQHCEIELCYGHRLH